MGQTSVLSPSFRLEDLKVLEDTETAIRVNRMASHSTADTSIVQRRTMCFGVRFNVVAQRIVALLHFSPGVTCLVQVTVTATIHACGPVLRFAHEREAHMLRILE